MKNQSHFIANLKKEAKIILGNTLKQDYVEINEEKVFSNCDKDVIKNKKVTFGDPLYTYADAVKNNSSI